MDARGAFISVGSNIQSESHVPSALISLSKSLKIENISTHYRTAPLGARSGEEEYLNGVWMIEARGNPAGLKVLLREIEETEGRIRTDDSYESRTLDLDLLLWGDLVDPELGLPDADLLERPFLYYPVLELADDTLWPLTRRPLRDMVPYNLPFSLRTDDEITGILRGIVDGQG